MTPEKTKELYAKFPNLYKVKCGFACQDGWFDLLYDLSEKLESMIVDYIKTDPEDKNLIPHAVQIKEKFGFGRFYISCHNSDFNHVKMYNYIEEFEEKSHKICEYCGASGKGRSLPWVRTLCNSHYKEEKNMYYNRAKDDYIMYKQKLSRTDDSQYEKLILSAKERMAIYQ